jgi:hypothetical protein
VDEKEIKLVALKMAVEVVPPPRNVRNVIEVANLFSEWLLAHSQKLPLSSENRE